MDEGDGGGGFLRVVATDARVVDHGARDVVVGWVVGVEHGGGDVGHVAAGVGLAGYEDLVVLDAEDVFPILEELDEILSGFFLCCSFMASLSVACSDGLLDPEHVC